MDAISHIQEHEFGVLTNGVVYKFFTDQNETNKMDEEPFWEVSLESLSDRDLEQLENFVNGSDVAEAVTAASRLKYIAGMKKTLSQQYHDELEDAFAEWLARPLLPPRSRMTSEIKGMARQALHEFIEELVIGRLRGNQQPAPALEEGQPFQQSDDSLEETNEKTPEAPSSVVTTDEELEGLEIVKSIVSSIVDPERVKMRDNPSYCPVFLDSNRKPLCRFYFDGQQKQIGLFDGSRYSGGSLIASMHDIGSVQEILDHADQLRETAQHYLES